MSDSTDCAPHLAFFPSGQHKENPNQTKALSHPSSPAAPSLQGLWQVSDESPRAAPTLPTATHRLQAKEHQMRPPTSGKDAEQGTICKGSSPS